jgi:hypothetical protein
METWIKACDGRKYEPLKAPAGPLGSYFDWVTRTMSRIVASTTSMNVSTSASASTTTGSSAPSSSTSGPPKPSTAANQLPPASPSPGKPPPPSDTPKPLMSLLIVVVTTANAQGSTIPFTTTQITVLPPPSGSIAPTSAPTTSFSTPQIAGTAAGGAAFLALAIGVLFYILHRRRRNKSYAYSPATWDPNFSSDRKPKLPDIDGSGSTGYESHAAIGSGAAVTEKKKAIGMKDKVKKGVKKAVKKGA